MLKMLAEAEELLPKLLQDDAIWQSLYVDYHPPFVERLWTPWGSYRINLHRIHPCPAKRRSFTHIPGPRRCTYLKGNMKWQLVLGVARKRRPLRPS